MNLNIVKWGDFFIAGKDGIFELRSSNSGIDKNKLLEGDIETVPYITRSDINNGLNLFVSEEQNGKYHIDPQNVITIGLDTQTVFYQPYQFYTGQNIQVLSNEYIDKYNALFITRLLKIQLKKFNWGGNGATLGRLARTKIKLPIDKEGNPNYEFMRNYVLEMERVKKEQYYIYAIKRIKDMKYKEVCSLEKKKWKEFNIENIFRIESGKRLTVKDMINGDRPFIGSTYSNNGITNYVSNSNASLDKNVLGVNYNGSVVENFYHKYECIFSDDVKRFHLLNYQDNEYVLLFFKNIILQQKEKYMYAYKFNENRMKKQIILVPVDDNENPDYEYMEQYIKNMMIKKYQEYLGFIE